MRTSGLFFLLSLLPTVCFGLLFTVEGNKPQSEANYEEWPKLVEVVNDPSRVRLVWCNGDEQLYYRGNTEALRRVVQKFSEVEADELRVVIRPALRIPKEQAFDWQLHITQGIASAGISRNGDTPVEDECPTLTIYVSENIKLPELIVPGNLVVDQLKDLKARYEKAKQTGNGHAKDAATRAIQALEADAARQGEEGKRYSAQLQGIDEWVRLRKASAQQAKPLRP
jgi:hypothetical protein